MVYRNLVQRWREELSRPEFKILKEFSRHMDRNSFNLARVEVNQEFWAFYTNEAIWLKFTRGEMEHLLELLQKGEPWSWPEIIRDHSVKKERS